MIEIKAKLMRADCPIFATGEMIECFIEFTHKKEIEVEKPTKNSVIENLAWASGQLHCYRKTSFPVAQDKISDLTESIRKTTLDAATQSLGDIIIATKPKILFCDLKLKPGETKTYIFHDFLPRDGPPTYRGHDIKYFYKITIATQRVKSKVQTLTIPIRVLPIPIAAARTEEIQCTEETVDELTPTNPFLEKRELTELELSWHYLKNMTSRRAPKHYRISNRRGYVGRFCLFKPCYKIGEDIVGSLDFSKCQVRCVQFSVKLQCQEISHQFAANHADGIADMTDGTSSVKSLDMASVASGTAAVGNYHKSATSGSVIKSKDMNKDNKGGGTAATGANNSGIAEIDESSGKISSFATHHQVCFAIQQTQVIIPIPLHITPSFNTNLVDVRWRLHFEFVTSTMMNFGPLPEVGQIQAPAEINVETMAWNLPITICAANPLQIHTPSQAYNLLIK